MNIEATSSNNKSQPVQQDKKIRLPYTKPKLQQFGDIRDLTLGSSPGVADSGSMGKNGGM